MLGGGITAGPVTKAQDSAQFVGLVDGNLPLFLRDRAPRDRHGTGFAPALDVLKSATKPVALIGRPGSGRSTLLRTVAACGGPVVAACDRVDAVRRVGEGWEAREVEPVALDGDFAPVEPGHPATRYRLPAWEAAWAVALGGPFDTLADRIVARIAIVPSATLRVLATAASVDLVDLDRAAILVAARLGSSAGDMLEQLGAEIERGVVVTASDAGVRFVRPGLAAALAASSLDPTSRPTPVLDDVLAAGNHLVGRTPVTVGQFATFVDDGGYRASTLPFAEPLEWDLQRDHPRRPVTGISWFEADAFCRWLARRTGRQCQMVSVEASLAAASPDGRKHPWGEEPPTPERLNFAQHVGRPTDVDAHPRGAGPFGHLDLVGNVWQWCADGDGEHRVVRAGGWFTNAAYVRSDYTFSFHALNRFHDLGFRIQVVDQPDPTR